MSSFAPALLDPQRPYKQHSSNSTSSAQRFYRPELDALRFFAFFCVFATHYRRPAPDVHGPAWALHVAGFARLLQDCGSFGMLIFFLLSSYLITELLLRERAQTGSIHLKAFYMRRILRIWPLYFFALGACAVVSKLVPDFWMGMPRFLAMLLLAGNWFVVFHGYGVGPYGPLWSISLEEQFYLLWPATARWAGRRSIFVASLLLVPISLATLAIGAAHRVAMQPSLYTNSLVQFLLFALGALLALGLHGKPFTAGPLSRLLLLTGGLGLWLVAEGELRFLWTVPMSPFDLVVGFSATAVGCVCIFLAFSGAPSVLFPRPLIYLGKISYGLYVFHMGAIILLQRTIPHLPHDYFVRAVLTLAITVATAHLSYRYLETPFLRLKERFEFVKSRPA